MVETDPNALPVINEMNPSFEAKKPHTRKWNNAAVVVVAEAINANTRIHIQSTIQVCSKRIFNGRMPDKRVRNVGSGGKEFENNE